MSRIMNVYVLLVVVILRLYTENFCHGDEQFLDASAYPTLDQLPNPFVSLSGTTIAHRDQWPERRDEIQRMLLHYVYGHAPAVATSVKAVDVKERLINKETTREIVFHLEIAGGEQPFRMQAGLLVPNATARRYPIILAIDPVWQPHVAETAKLVNDRGYAFAGFVYHDIDDDNADRLNGIYPAFPGNDWATLAAWSWGASRMLDYLATRQDIDVSQSVITGHSRCGKAALLAGSLDPRFALTAPHASGAGGAGSFRLQPPGVETLELITAPERFHYWFHPRLRTFVGHERQLPFDSHFLKSLVAPRALLTIEALGDTWANPEGTWATHLAAREVYRFLHAEQMIMAHYRPGGHDMTRADWIILLEVADHIFRHAPRPESLSMNPFPDHQRSFLWTAPGK